jgi:hypothetical protein
LAAAAPWYKKAGITYVGLVDTAHRVSELFNLVNVPSAVWIDEQGIVRRIDEGTYATVHKNGDFEYGRDDYAPMVEDWVKRGESSPYVAQPVALVSKEKTADQAKAAPAFRLGVHFKALGQAHKASEYWQQAQALNPESWNYHRQDWSYTPEQAGSNWQKKVQQLEGKPYYKPITELSAEGED